MTISKKNVLTKISDLKKCAGGVGTGGDEPVLARVSVQNPVIKTPGEKKAG